MWYNYGVKSINSILSRRLKMDFPTAVKILAGKVTDDSTYTKIIKVPGNILATTPLAPRSKTVEFTAREMAIQIIASETGADGDWIANGDWSGDETFESIRAEWEKGE